ncbi:hypothetical protein PG984_013830 [Apiospora sp. TS-2023a]
MESASSDALLFTQYHYSVAPSCRCFAITLAILCSSRHYAKLLKISSPPAPSGFQPEFAQDLLRHGTAALVAAAPAVRLAHRTLDDLSRPLGH